MKINKITTINQPIKANRKISFGELKGDLIITPILKNDEYILRNTKNLIENMIKQRNFIKINGGKSINDKLAESKSHFVEENRKIRENIHNYLYRNQPLQDLSFELDNSIKQSKIPEDVILYRGTCPYDFGLLDMSDEFIEKFYKKDRLFQIPIFPSTSLKKSIGEKFAQKYTSDDLNLKGLLYKINCPKDTNGIYMEKLKLSPSHDELGEEEILLPRNLIYQFKSLTEKNNYIEIELDIIKKKPVLKKIHEFWKED